MTLTEETLLKLIKDLSKRDGYCFALNKMLAETCRISERQVRRILSKFEDEGVVTVTFYKNVSRMREIRVVERAEIVTLPVGQYVHVPGHIVRPLNKGVDIKLDTWKKERKKPPDKPTVGHFFAAMKEKSRGRRLRLPAQLRTNPMKCPKARQYEH